MELKVKTDQDSLTVYLRGELDHHVCGRLREEIDNAVIQSGTKWLILDFANVGFMDSSGIGLILGRYKHLLATGGTLRVRGASQKLRQVMCMAGLQKLDIFEEDMV